MFGMPLWLVVGLCIFIGIHLLLSIIYFENWLYLRKANLKHYLFVKGLATGDPDDKKESDDASVWLGARKAEIKRRILKLGLKENVHPYMEPVGFGQVLSVNLGVLDNILYNDRSLQNKVRQHLSDSCGYSAVVARRHLNPIYWLETLIFLPKALAAGIGVDSDKAAPIINILQGIYTLLGIYLILMQTGLIELLKQTS